MKKNPEEIWSGVRPNLKFLRDLQFPALIHIIECLLFAAEISRPNVCYAINYLTRFSTNPGKVHLETSQHIMRYLKGTIDKLIIHRNQIHTHICTYIYIAI